MIEQLDSTDLSSSLDTRIVEPLRLVSTWLATPGAVFLEALFAGSLVSPGALEETTKIGPNGYGLGLFEVPLGSRPAGYGHNGAIPGYNATMAIDPETGDTVVVVSSSDAFSADELALNILQL